jgi:hypothetical protein
MGIDVALMEVSQQGTSPRRRRVRQRAVVIDRDDFFVSICRGSGKPMLSRADPYGDLVLTQSEMDQFIAEIKSLISESGVLNVDRLRQIVDLASKCRDDPNSELHLQGD